MLLLPSRASMPVNRGSLAKNGRMGGNYTYHHHSKTSCFGLINLPLMNEKHASDDTKTTCFAIVRAFSIVALLQRYEVFRNKANF